ncbi:MAG TPA: leucine--tRNA ligase [Tepidisphaeraceae bacterium]|jgi:leucyl-tRNA synthetase|nr:leucine--tRNA ligase [Tepidisphaeraceae bacterium]
MPYNFTAIEKKWQQFWLQNGSFRTLEPAQAGKMPKSYILDMFPYPSGAGLHVGHPEGYTATDIVARYLRMKGHNVLHPMGWDAFGLPAEQYAIKQNVQPRITTEQNIANFRRQIQMLGLSYDWDREIDTTDPSYYRWTQWIFLQLFNSYFDPVENKAQPISQLMHELKNGKLVVAPDGSIHLNPTQEGMDAIGGEMRIERLWHELEESERRDAIDGQRLAYMDDALVNWCAGLGTVLANEEVIDGKSEVGGFPVVRQPMRQWVLRITAYAERLLGDLESLQWPESLKEMQRNWIGKSVGSEVDFDIDPASVPPASAGQNDEELMVTVYTTRPDTLYGATYMVLSPEHPLVSRITSLANRPAVDAYRAAVAHRSERDRLAETKDKTGAFTGAYAVNPVNDERIPIWIADYVLMGYGTGAIMAVPAHDQRDYEFATKFKLPIRTVVKPRDGSQPPARRAFEEPGIAVNSLAINGLPTAEAKERMIHVLSAEGTGRPSVKYKLRDWIFSRQRYWGEPFPIILDAEGNAYAVPEEQLPVTLPEVSDFRPTGTLEPPLSKARDWMNVTLDGQPAVRETNTMPQWAGSCWYYLRYIDPRNPNRFVDPEKERYWMPVDLYVGGAEHAVLHLLYSRFWHKVLFDLGHVSTPEPFQRLVNQGTILGEAEYTLYETADKRAVSAADVEMAYDAATDTAEAKIASTGEKVFPRRIEETDVQRTKDGWALKSDPAIAVDSRSFKMSKSRGNVVTPDQIVGDYGADTFRLYEMYMGPLEAQKPWNTRDIVGMSRFLNGVYRNLVGDEEAGKTAQIVDAPPPPEIDRQLHRTIKKVAEDIESLRFNTAIAELIKLNNEIGRLASGVSRELAETFVLLLAPFAPHLAEEIWSRLGHSTSLARHPWPKYDEAKLTESTLELPVQINGKLRGTVSVSAEASEEQVLDAAQNVASVKPWLAGKTIAKKIYVQKKLVSFVVK